MARKLWIVITDTQELFSNPEYYRGQALLANTDQQISKFGVFSNKRYAEEFAQQACQMNPGKEVYILESTHGFYNRPSPTIVRKMWDGEEYVTRD